MQVAESIRTDAGYSQNEGILIFTEKRLHAEVFHQLLVGGNEADEDPPSIAVLSLHFLRVSYEKEKIHRPILFRALLSNLLFSLGIDIGLKDHGGEVRGCIMDFCEHMHYVEVGLRNGPCFCNECATKLRSANAEFLLELATAALASKSSFTADEEVTEAIVLRGKRYSELGDGFDFDIALSFAGADRSKAELLARSLRENGLSVFYDTDAQAELWGKNLQLHLSELYRLRAQFCIVLVSENYSSSRWANVELTAALSREFEHGKEYILPLRLDDSEVHGILPTKGYIYWQDYSVAEIAHIVLKKITSNQASG